MSSLARQFESPAAPPRLQLVPVPESTLNEDYAPKEHAVLLADFFKRARIRAEDREAEHARMRREVVGYVLTQSGVTTEEVTASEAFAKSVREAENAQIDLRSDRLGDLADRYEDHPFSETMDHLRKEFGKGQFANQVITMRRAGLLMLEKFDAEQ